MHEPRLLNMDIQPQQRNHTTVEYTLLLGGIHAENFNRQHSSKKKTASDAVPPPRSTNRFTSDDIKELCRKSSTRPQMGCVMSFNWPAHVSFWVRDIKKHTEVSSQTDICTWP